MDIVNAADTFTLMLHAIDRKDWDGVRAAFADRVDIDYSSLFGAPAATVNASDQVDGWHALARHFDATQHLTGPFVVTADGQDAIARTHVRAYHRMTGLPGGDVWMVAGHYEVRLRQIQGSVEDRRNQADGLLSGGEPVDSQHRALTRQRRCLTRA